MVKDHINCIMLKYEIFTATSIYIIVSCLGIIYVIIVLIFVLLQNSRIGEFLCSNEYNRVIRNQVMHFSNIYNIWKLCPTTITL